MTVFAFWNQPCLPLAMVDSACRSATSKVVGERIPMANTPSIQGVSTCSQSSIAVYPTGAATTITVATGCTGRRVASDNAKSRDQTQNEIFV